MPVLRKLTQPQMWRLGGDDIEAPSQETQRRLSALAAEGRPIEGAVFPQADHGIFEFETDASSGRLHTRMAEGYLPMQWTGSSTAGSARSLTAAPCACRYRAESSRRLRDVCAKFEQGQGGISDERCEGWPGKAGRASWMDRLRWLHF